MSEAFNLEGMTSKEIVNLVRRKTNKRITLSLKSKKSIVKLAKELLGVTAELRSTKVVGTKTKSPEVGTSLFLPDTKALYSKIAKKEIEDFLNNFAKERIISRSIMSYIVTSFALVESKNQRVADVIVDANNFCKLRRYGKDQMLFSEDHQELVRGLSGCLWGARVWIQDGIKGIECYPERSIEKKYPRIAESKRLLGIKD